MDKRKSLRRRNLRLINCKNLPDIPVEMNKDKFVIRVIMILIAIGYISVIVLLMKENMNLKEQNLEYRKHLNIKGKKHEQRLNS